MVVRLLWIASLALAAPVVAQRIQGHVLGGFGATGGSGYTYASRQVGLGAEMLVARGVGFGVDVTALADNYTAVGIGSANGVWRFWRSGKTEAYLSGGFSSASYEAGASDRGFNVGGGVNWWRGPRFGVRIEPRYYGFSLGSRPVHVFGVRAGIVFGGGREHSATRRP